MSIIISLVLAAIVASIVIQSYTRDKQDPYRKIPYNRSGVNGVTNLSWVLTDNVSQITLVGHSYSLDATSQTLSIGWEILGCGAYRLTTLPPMIELLAAVGCDALDRAVDIYFYA